MHREKGDLQRSASVLSTSSGHSAESSVCCLNLLSLFLVSSFEI